MSTNRPSKQSRTVGEVATTFAGAACATYVKSVDHFRNEIKKAGVEVVIQNHPLMLPLQAWLDRFETRKKGDPNPFVVGKAGYQKFVDVLYACSEINLARRKST